MASSCRPTNWPNEIVLFSSSIATFFFPPHRRRPPPPKNEGTISGSAPRASRSGARPIGHGSRCGSDLYDTNHSLSLSEKGLKRRKTTRQDMSDYKLTLLSTCRPSSRAFRLRPRHSAIIIITVRLSGESTLQVSIRSSSSSSSNLAGNAIN